MPSAIYDLIELTSGKYLICTTGEKIEWFGSRDVTKNTILIYVYIHKKINPNYIKLKLYFSIFNQDTYTHTGGKKMIKEHLTTFETEQITEITQINKIKCFSPSFQDL